MFKLSAKFQPTGDQPQAIKKLTAGFVKGYRDQTLLGVTGSGKTFTMANVIQQMQKPTLVISHNKTLAAQLASEFRDFFPRNAVHYFVSYYDYYQPEAYLPTTDTYIEKATQINEEIDRLRHASTQALLTRRDVIIVASVSCIYGLGSPEEYEAAGLTIKLGQHDSREKLIRQLVDIYYQRNDLDFHRGTFRVLGEALEIFPAYGYNIIRLEFDGDLIEKILTVNPLTRKTISQEQTVLIFPAKHFVTRPEKLPAIFKQIRQDLAEQLKKLQQQNKPLEAHRLQQRTNYDLELIQQTGYCNGIENYSRYFNGRKPGEPPYTLIDYFPQDYLLFIDESHMTIPQLRGMYNGDQSRKQTLVDYGFRLPSAKDNRPLKFPEFDQKINRVIYVSATPEEYELKLSKQVAEQLIRPTGLLDPQVAVRPTKNQMDNLIGEMQKRVKNNQRILVTTLTKRLAEDLTDYLSEKNIKVHYLHSEIQTLERLEILRDLRLGEYDVVVGINLLREGLDLPEVSLVAILDADKEGFLRSRTSLIQTMGRAARHQDGQVLLYADKLTKSMKAAMAEANRRRKIQQTYNHKHGITPQSIKKAVRDDRLAGQRIKATSHLPKLTLKFLHPQAKIELIKELKEKMELAAKNLEFETAAGLRDQIKQLHKA